MYFARFYYSTKKQTIEFTMHEWVRNVIAVTNPSQYTRSDKKNLKNENRDWSEIGPKYGFRFLLLLFLLMHQREVCSFLLGELVGNSSLVQLWAVILESTAELSTS